MPDAANIPEQDKVKLRSLARHALRNGADLVDVLELMRRAWMIGFAAGTGIGGNEDPQSLAAIERKAIVSAYMAEGANALKAAERLQIGRTTMYRKLAEYGMHFSLSRAEVREVEFGD